MALSRQHLNDKEVFKALTDNATFATVLHVICLAAYGPEIYEVDILELEMRLSEDFHAQLTEENESKLNAILLATHTNIFYEQQEAFQSICHTLLEGDPGLDFVSNLTVPEILWGVYEVEINHGPHAFQPGVLALIQDASEDEGLDPEAEQADPSDHLNVALEEARTKLQRQLEAIGSDMAHHLPPIQGSADQGQSKALLTA